MRLNRTQRRWLIRWLIRWLKPLEGQKVAAPAQPQGGYGPEEIECLNQHWNLPCAIDVSDLAEPLGKSRSEGCLVPTGQLLVGSKPLRRPRATTTLIGTCSDEWPAWAPSLTVKNASPYSKSSTNSPWTGRVSTINSAKYSQWPSPHLTPFS